MKLHLLILLILFSSNIIIKAEIVLFVSPFGNDSHIGSLEKPFKSLERALLEAKTLKSSSPKQAIKIYLREGEYLINKSIFIDNSISGSADEPTLISGYQNEKVLFTGASKIPSRDFQKAINTKYKLNQKIANHILSAQLTVDNIPLEDDLFPHGFGYKPENSNKATSMLFIDNKAYELGRWPNKDKPIIKIKEVLDKGTISRNGKVSNPKGGKFISQDPIPNWEQKENIWIYGYFAYGFADDNIKLREINKKNNTITTEHPHIYGFHASSDTSDWGLKHAQKVRGFYYYNILEEVDQPGEYFYDGEKNTIYVYPDSTLMEINDIRLTKFDQPFLMLERVNYLIIENIEFKYSRGLGIYMGYVSHININNCRFENLGGRAISMGDTYPTELKNELINQNNNTYVRITNCYINNTGAGGIYLNGGNNKLLISGNNLVENCEISNFNLFNKTYAPAVHITGVGHTVRHCYIHSAPHMAILFQGNNILLEYNKVENVCQNASDMGAFYTGRNQAEQNNIIRYNYFDNIYKDEDNRICAVYLDDGTVGHYVYSNIFYRCGNPTDKGSFGAIHVNGGYNNHFDNNIFINCKQALGNSVWTEEKWKSDLSGPDLQNKLTNRVDINSVSYKDAYPNLHTILDTTITPIRYNYSNNNIAYMCDNFAAGNYLNSNMLFIKDSEKGNPFVDYNNKNFNLIKTLRLNEILPNFKTIPYDRIGIINNTK